MGWWRLQRDPLGTTEGVETVREGHQEGGHQAVRDVTIEGDVRRNVAIDKDGLCI